MAITHKKNFGVYHWDTFDNETILMAEYQTLLGACKFVQRKYKDRIDKNGADRVDVVNKEGEIEVCYYVK